MVTASYSDAVSLSKSVPLIDVNLIEGMEMAIEYLKKNGHSKIAFGVPYDNNTYDSSRSIAYKEILRPILKNKINDYMFSEIKPVLRDDKRSLLFKTENPFDNCEVDEDYFEKGVIAAQTFVERKSDATAIVCFNDEFAIGMCNQFRKIGVRVPEDVSVIGFDGTYNRKYFQPLITTVGLFPVKIGAKCVEVLLDIIDGKNNKYIVHSPVKIIEGKSVKNIRK